MENTNNIQINTVKWGLQTRLLHMGLALAVSLQLLISLVMEAPDHKNASAFARTAYEAHEIVGMAALVIVLLHWLWSMASRMEGGLARLFPWSTAGLGEVRSDIAQLKNGSLPQGGPRGGLPGLVHGLGFLAVTGMVITGGILFFIFPEVGKPGAMADFFAEFHEFIATFVWIYWGGHIALAVFHKLAGHDTVQAMFSLK